MSRNRLEYETLAGNIAPAETFKQLTEYLRLMEEDARSLRAHAKRRNDDSLGEMWGAIARNFKKIEAVVTGLAKDRTSTGVGFGD